MIDSGLGRSPYPHVTFPDRVSVNSTDLWRAIAEGQAPMREMLDPEHGQLPYFYDRVAGPEIGLSHHESYSLSHVPGRWLNAMLSAEDSAGIGADEELVALLADWTFTSFNSPMGLSRSLDLHTFEPTMVSELHNLREAMHALNALIKYRQSDKALEIAKRQISVIDACYNFEANTWDEKKFNTEYHGRTRSLTGAPFFPRHLGRYIGPLVKLYRATGLEEALVQAIRLGEYALRNVLTGEGEYRLAVLGDHAHSVTSMMSSLAQLGQVLGDNSILRRVMTFVENGLREIAVDFGWCVERYTLTGLVGEINNTGDILETCLILARSGRHQYWQRAERILRAHMLPAQLLDVRFIPDEDHPKNNRLHRIASRSHGAFGFPCPYGHQYSPEQPINFHLDIVGGGVASLCEAFREKATLEEGLLSVNLHFDHDDDHFSVKSPYTNRDVMEIRLKESRPLRVRLSDWVDRSSLRAVVNGRAVEGFCSGAWLYLTGLKAGDTVKIPFTMKVETLSYHFRSNVFTIRWRGDAVEAMANPGRPLTFFDPL